MAKPPTYRMKSRMIIVLVAMVVFGFCVVVHSLFQIQIVQGKEWEGYALRQQLQTIPIEAERGSIYDANGKVLAKSATVWSVCISPNDLVVKGSSPEAEAETKKNRDAVADCLNKILGLDKESLYKTMEKTKSKYEVVKTKVEKPTADLLLAEIDDKNIKGIFLEQNTRRYYPYGNFAASVLGFTNLDNVGAAGLESYYDKVLSGVSGRTVSLRNRRGVNMPMQYEQSYDAKNGNSLVLTIDETLQHYLEKNLEIAYAEHKVKNRVTGIIMDVKTGAILAMADKPDFDPNDAYSIFDPATIAKLEELNYVGNEEAYNKAVKNAKYAQWRNSSISDPYEPGSVFKIITTAGALESGAVTDKSTFYCSGFVEVADRIQRCWIWSSKHVGHGQQTLAEAVKNSCNPAFIDIGQRMGASRFMEYFKNFGLTKGTGIDLPGEANSIYHQSLSISDLSSSAFGQTFKVTPIQMITSACAAVNGGKLMQPYVVKQIIDQNGDVVSTTEPTVKRQVVSEEISKQVALMLEQVVEAGSGTQARIPGYRVGGKTGTSEKLDKLDEEGNPVRLNTLSFFGFAPVDDPQIACLVLVDEPDLENVYGSTIAAPIVGSILADALPYLGIEAQQSTEETEKKPAKTPNLTNLNIHDAEADLRTKGIKFRVVGAGTKVLRQIPENGAPFPVDGIVVLYTEEVTQENMVIVPDVSGKTPEEANAALVGLGLNFSMSGEKVDGAVLKAASQSPAAGEQVAAGTMVAVEFIQVTTSEDKKS